MFPDVYGCEEGRYLECVHYGEGTKKLFFISLFLKTNWKFFE